MQTAFGPGHPTPARLEELPRPGATSVRSCRWQLLSWQRREPNPWHCWADSCCGSGEVTRACRDALGRERTILGISPRVSKTEATLHQLNENAAQSPLQEPGKPTALVLSQLLSTLIASCPHVSVSTKARLQVRPM